MPQNEHFFIYTSQSYWKQGEQYSRKSNKAKTIYSYLYRIKLY